MADTRALLAGLEAYQQSVERHVTSLHQQFEGVSRCWAVLNECFAGNAADEFRPIWENTSQRFREYVEHTTAIVRVLGERVEGLREADRRAGLGG
jgi:uncharacterized protein YukE